MADYPNFAGEAQFKDTASVPTPPANNLAVYSDGGVLKTKNSSGAVKSVSADMVGGTSSAAGTAGLVPAPAAGTNTRMLFSNATFAEFPLYPPSAQTTRYVMSHSPYAVQGNMTINNKVRIFNLIWVPSDGNIGTISFRSGINAPTPAHNVHCALWELASDFSPGTFVLGGTASTPASNTTNVDIAISPSVAVKRGWYWASLTPDANTATNGIRALDIQGRGYMASWLGSTNVNDGFVTYTYTATTYNQTTHETFSLSALSIPAIAVKYV